MALSTITMNRDIIVIFKSYFIMLIFAKLNRHLKIATLHVHCMLKRREQGLKSTAYIARCTRLNFYVIKCVASCGRLMNFADFSGFHRENWLLPRVRGPLAIYTVLPLICVEFLTS